MRAWLVTWEWIGEHARRDDKIAAIFEARSSADKIRRFVEVIYLYDRASLNERIACTQRRGSEIWRARFVDTNGVPWKRAIHCGENPFLFAEKVSNLRVLSIPDADVLRVTWISAAGRPMEWSQPASQ